MIRNIFPHPPFASTWVDRYPDLKKKNLKKKDRINQVGQNQLAGRGLTTLKAIAKQSGVVYADDPN